MGASAANICSKALRNCGKMPAHFFGQHGRLCCGWPEVRAVQVLSIVYTTAVNDVVGSASWYAPSKVSLQPSQRNHEGHGEDNDEGFGQGACLQRLAGRGRVNLSRQLHRVAPASLCGTSHMLVQRSAYDGHRACAHQLWQQLLRQVLARSLVLQVIRTEKIGFPRLP